MPPRNPPLAFPGGGCVGVVTGSGMLLGGGVTTAGLAWQGAWPIAGLTAYFAVMGALLLLEARLLRKRRTPADPVSPGELAPPALPPSARPCRTPIWLHLILQMVVIVPAFFSGAIVGFFLATLAIMALASLGPAEAPPEPAGWASTLWSCCVFLIGAPLFFGGAVLGGGQARRLFLEYVPALCPACGAGAYCEIGSPVTYHCRSCGHVHVTNVHAR